MTQTEQLVVICLLLTIHQFDFTFGWTWSCVNNSCVRGADPTNPELTETMEVCRLTCGQYGVLWPQPTGYTSISNQVLLLDPSRIHFDYSSVADIDQEPVRELMTSVTRLFVDNLNRTCENSCNLVPDTLVNIHFATTSGDLTLSWLTDESYSVEITSKVFMPQPLRTRVPACHRANSIRSISCGSGSKLNYAEVAVYIKATTVYGARHALETVSQLIATSDNQLVIVASAIVSDKPAYPHRGLLLDTARNYLPLYAIQRTINAMSACKLNVLHWHATDSQSFPLLLPRVPQLARYGAYSAEEVYTAADLEMLINYARVRGIHLLMEIDGPAHAGNGWQWGPDVGLGNLAVCVNYQPWKEFCLQPPCGQLNPANPNLYIVLKNLFIDLVDRLPAKEIFHMGGDEVYIPCWMKSKEVTSWMVSRGMGLTLIDFLNVWGEYHQKVLQIWDEVVGNTQTSVVIWTSHLTNPNIISNYLSKDRYIIEVWTNANDSTADRLLEMGYRVIMATRDTWYLDHGFWGDTEYHKWSQAYNSQLIGSPGVVGGEAAMWGELVDENNLDQKVWPRAAAVAERLWTNPSTNNTVQNRMLEFRQRLIKRGVKPESISPGWCAQNQGGCAGSINIT